MMHQVNIVSNNYSRYGTSIYQQLYGNLSSSSSSSARRNDISRTTRTNNAGVMDTNQEVTNCDNASVVFATSKIKQKYKNLIISSSKKMKKKKKKKKLIPVTLQKPAFIRRTKSNETYKTIDDLPIEVIVNILSFVDNDTTQFNKSLYYCLYVNKMFYRSTKILLYYNPFLTSTYRVAQFVTSLRLYPENGTLVKCLDLSLLKNGLLNNNTSNKREQEPSDIENNNNGDEIDPNGGNSENVTNLKDSSTLDDESYQTDLALATWRDWRYRHDPLYSSPILNSYNIKRTRSRSASSSSLSITTMGSPALTQSIANINSLRSHSDNTTSSFANSFMSSLSNSFTNHGGLSTPAKSSISIPQLAIDKTSKATRLKNNTNLNKRTWLKNKLNLKCNRQGIADITTATSSTEEEVIKEDFSETAEKESIKKRKHPYANKFLMKYTSYRDLPIGYILHLLKACPNLVEIDLSNVVISNDFHIISSVGNSLANNKSSMLPKKSNLTFVCPEKESIIPTRSDYSLEAVHFTDSRRGHEYYERLSKSNSIMDRQISNYPLPIDNQTKYREEFKRNYHKSGSIIGSSKTKCELQQINSSEIFDRVFLNDQKNTLLKAINMNGIIWCREYMIKNFVLSLYQEKVNRFLNLSFTKSGLNRRVPWATAGTLSDLVGILIVDEVLQYDDLLLEDLFNLKKSRNELNPLECTDLDIFELTDHFSINFGKVKDIPDKSMNCKIIIKKSEDPTNFTVNSTNKITTLTIMLYSKSHIIFTGIALDHEFISKPCKKMDRLSRELLSKIRELRSEELRRNMGENSYNIA